MPQFEIHNKRALILLAISHVVDDLYLGALPAMLPFLVSERHYTYAEAGGITLAATVVSSIAQPLFGVLADKRHLPLLTAVSLPVVAIGIAGVGLLDMQALVWLSAAIAGLGVAAYHPSAARSARIAAGGAAKGMGWFALGGNAGLALGPVLATPLLLAFGLRGIAFLMIPAFLMSALLFRLHVSSGRQRKAAATATDQGIDRWNLFRWLSGIVVLRSIMYYGITTLMALFVIEELSGSETQASITLSTFLAVGAGFTLIGGYVADRFGRLVSIRIGYCIIPIGLLILITAPHTMVAVLGAAVAGIGMYLPFAVQTALAQEYLPNRVGTASGVTLGLAVSAGGVFAPVFGWVADRQGLTTGMSLVLILPVIALLLSTRLREVSPASG